MFDKLILWCIKQLVRLWDRHDDAMAFTFSGGEKKDYAIIVERFYGDYYTIGTAMYPVNKPPKEEDRELHSLRRKEASAKAH